jgi:hypothetical protein
MECQIGLVDGLSSLRGVLKGRGHGYGCLMVSKGVKAKGITRVILVFQRLIRKLEQRVRELLGRIKHPSFVLAAASEVPAQA